MTEERRPAWEALCAIAAKAGYCAQYRRIEMDDGFQLARVSIEDAGENDLCWAAVYGRRLGDDEPVRGRLARDVLAQWALERLGVAGE